MAEFTIRQLGEALCMPLQTGLGQTDDSAIRRTAEAIAQEVVSSHYPQPDAVRRIDRDLFDPDVAYAIPDDALALVPSLTLAVVSALGGGLLAAVPELVGVLYRYRTLRVEINADEAMVLRALRAANKSGVSSLAPAEIHNRLAGDGLSPKRPLNEVLRSLEAKKTDKATLVREINGRWAIEDV
jgi:hypothetical protein